jgi:hypothetical protein
MNVIIVADIKSNFITLEIKKNTIINVKDKEYNIPNIILLFNFIDIVRVK